MFTLKQMNLLKNNLIQKAGGIMSSTHSKNEETLAVILEEINKKLDEEIKIRKAMQKEQEQKTKAILQKLSKLQEYNEINDMRAIFMSKQIQNILEKLY